MQVSDFPHKKFNGINYDFGHLSPINLQVPLSSPPTSYVDLRITFGCHCFTEEFAYGRHWEQHRYTYKNELRAFDLTRHECSLQLPEVMQSMMKGRVYNADESYTYAAHIAIPSVAGQQSYSIFFSLEKDFAVPGPALRMFVKSAYLKPFVAKTNAQGWRFVSLAGQISGAFLPKEKKQRPQKKKAP